MSRSALDFLTGVERVASTALTLVFAYGSLKLVQYFVAKQPHSSSFSDESTKKWNSGTNILIGHQTTSSSVLKSLVDDKETCINEVTFNRVTGRFEEILAQHGENATVHLHLRTPGGQMYFAMLIAQMVYNWKGKVVAHVHAYSASGGTLIALACNEIVMDDLSVLGPIDPQVPREQTHYSATDHMRALNIDPTGNLLDADLPLFAAQGQKCDVRQAIDANISMLQSAAMLRTYKQFLERILSKNYKGAEHVQKLIAFFWIDRDHSSPIWRDQCCDVGLNVVAK